MQIVRCKTRDGSSYGIIENQRINLLDGPPFGDYSIIDSIPLAEAQLLHPCEPSKIIAIGINYAPHAKEIDFQIPDEPLIFLKPPSAAIGTGCTIMLPEMSKRVDYEGELAVVIGRTIKNIPEKEALDAVLGYTCFNDVTARDLQKKDIQFTRSKSFDTFAAFGPWIETELDPENLAIQTHLNSELRQSSNTSQMIRPVPELISFISRIMTLYPGDIIATGTPEGIGPLASGDTVTVTIEGIGTLINKVDA
ncbi:MAG: fumarylacetoacetate hydrolase family protein [Proteobacteria bacterium]|nr:fumarylacetoacetate hydrolase family protein [Pseudomonadota bacterium]MBU1709720.1 fumarylacetoacetate hydrolase family protein [Pseudomonadota bacterium]